MSSFEAPAPKKKLPILKLVIVAVVLAAGALLLLRGVDMRAVFQTAMDEIRARGPWVFFAAMAVLPALGFPVLAFGLTAGPAFSERMGMPAVVGCVLIAVTVNFLFTYALARRALEPILSKLLVRFGYRLPQVEADDSTGLVMILRLTPGIPFFVQNYLCGIAGVRFGKYLLFSCLISWPMNVAAVVFSDAVVQGKGRTVISAGMLLVAIVAATHLARKRYAKKPKPAA
ncbi:MAG: VTT domain-containing protein [Opitutaceae bacterium]